MPTRDELCNYDEYELTLLLKYLLLRQRDSADSILTLQYFFEITVILICKQHEASYASTSVATKYYRAFPTLATVRNILAHDLMHVDKRSAVIKALLDSLLLEQLSNDFLGSSEFVRNLEGGLFQLVDKGLQEVLTAGVDELAYGSKTVNIDEFYASLPSAVSSKYIDKLQCVIDNIHMLV